VVGVGAILSLTALLVSRRNPILIGSAFVVALALMLALGAGRVPVSSIATTFGEVVHEAESQYQTIAVAWDPRTGSRTVVLDNLVHGYVYPDNPTLLNYPYIAYFASVYRTVREARA